MALSRKQAEETADAPDDSVWARSLELYAEADPAGWDGCHLRGNTFGEPLYVITPTLWSDFKLWKWSAWDKWLRSFSQITLPASALPKRRRKKAERFSRGTRGRCVLGDTHTVQGMVWAACSLADLSPRQTEVWMWTGGYDRC